MAIILCLDSTTTNCTVAIAKDGKCLAFKEENGLGYSHSEKLHLFIQEILQDAKIDKGELDAVAVGKGPGSYTGLRIGTSTAKGLCFSLDIPLIAIPTLAILANSIEAGDGDAIISLLDARRMEVYSEGYLPNLDVFRDVRAEVVDADSYNEVSKRFKRVHLVGPGAAKCQEIMTESNLEFYPETYPSAKKMVNLAQSAFVNGQFEDLAYYEPFYLKDFVVGVTTIRKSV